MAIEALISTAIADFQPNVESMKARSHFQIPATIACHARQKILHLSDRSILAGIVQAGHARLAQLPAPAG